jgi:hypothetical protein
VIGSSTLANEGKYASVQEATYHSNAVFLKFFDELPRTLEWRGSRITRSAPVLCAPPKPQRGHSFLRVSYVIVAEGEG